VTHVVTGGERMTPSDQVATIGAVLGRELRFVEVPHEAARAGMLKSGMSEALADSILQLVAAAREGHDSEVASTVADVAGHPPRTFAEWVRDHVHAFR
jgi:uncharacterized protein YbjT (DUF2867 family)